MTATATTRQVLWTGGWDSTFRVLELLFETTDIVAPVYLVNSDRRSLQHEIRAMHSISREARRRGPDIERRLLETRFVERDRVPRSDEVTAALQRCKVRGFLGPQYDYLARYVRAHPELGSLELCIEQDSRPHVLMRTMLVPGDAPHVWRLPQAHVNSDLGILFHRMDFPLLEHSKIRMQEQAQHGGYLDILERSWFCHYPVGLAPCGTCSPCVQVVKAGLQHRLPKRARLRYLLSIDRRVREWRREHEPDSAV